MLVQRAWTTWPRWCSATPSAARTSWSSTATAWPSTRRRGAGPRAAVRGVADALHDRSRRGRGRAPARPAPPRQRAPPAPRERRSPELARRHAGRACAVPARPSAVGGELAPTARAGGGGLRARCAPACATTSRRTASSAWCSALSGGIDSALVALLAVDALGAGAGDLRVDALALLVRGHPGRRPRDRREPRHRVHASCDRGRDGAPTTSCCRAVRGHASPTSTEENLQARIRGNVVMALSNKFGWLVLTTGNKSELSVGYATLYGDMAGGFAVLKDVFKGWVYRLVRWRNEAGGARARAGVGARAPALGRAAPRAARRRLAAPLRGARRDPRGLRRGGPRRRASSSRRGLPAEDVERVIAHGRPRRVQAPPGPARASASPRRPSAATGACRSPTATRARPRRARAPPARAGSRAQLRRRRAPPSSRARWRTGGPGRR